MPHVPRFGDRIERALLQRLYRRPEAIVVHHEWVARGDSPVAPRP